MKGQQLTEHFRLEEFTRSTIASRHGICNEPSISVITNLQNLCQEVLEPLRNYYGKAIHINSGYRCRALNEKVHGVPDSQHIKGEAADLYLPSVETGRDWQRWIQMNCPHFDQAILERNRQGQWWLHVSARRQLHMNRHQTFMIVR
ncbi:MAG: peptidase M15 [Bacteroidales bacterium]|nr:peptidase M15 [Bacteroidales bacterium]